MPAGDVADRRRPCPSDVAQAFGRGQTQSPGLLRIRGRSLLTITVVLGFPPGERPLIKTSVQREIGSQRGTPANRVADLSCQRSHLVLLLEPVRLDNSPIPLRSCWIVGNGQAVACEQPPGPSRCRTEAGRCATRQKIARCSDRSHGPNQPQAGRSAATANPAQAEPAKDDPTQEERLDQLQGTLHLVPNWWAAPLSKIMVGSPEGPIWQAPPSPSLGRGFSRLSENPLRAHPIASPATQAARHRS
jgi:hypothetical protein